MAPVTKRIFQAAINEDRCMDLWDCLTEGGSATVDQEGKLALMPVAQLQQLIRGLTGSDEEGD